VLNPMRQRGGRPGEAAAEDKDEGPWPPPPVKVRKVAPPYNFYGFRLV
jgi:hypothetical protein